MATMVSGAVPVFLRLSNCTGEVEPTMAVPKLRDKEFHDAVSNVGVDGPLQPEVTTNAAAVAIT